jgi:chromosome segregation ATPase
MPSEDELKEHAKNSSETALANAVKQSNNTTVRQIAQAEIKRRQVEEKPMDDKEKDTFPSKEVMSGEGKKTKDQSDNEKYQSARKDLKAKTGKEPSEGEATKEYDKRQKESEKKVDEHDGKIDDHEGKIKDLEKEIKDLKDSLKHSFNQKPLLPREKEDILKRIKELEQDKKKDIKKGITGIQYF